MNFLHLLTSPLRRTDGKESLEPKSVALGHISNYIRRLLGGGAIAKPMSMLESFPPELKSMILFSLPDTQTLSALVHASPYYHQAYYLEREPLLSAVLPRELGQQVLVDAVTAVRAAKVPTKSGSSATIKDFLARYRIIRTRGETSTTDNPFEGFADGCRLHATVRAVARHFSRSAVETSHQGSEGDFTEPNPSRTELGRINRAFYRFETFCRLFGRRLPELKLSVQTRQLLRSIAGMFPTGFWRFSRHGQSKR
jgi:hypothetical protein